MPWPRSCIGEGSFEEAACRMAGAQRRQLDVRIDTGGTVAAIASDRSSRSPFGFVSENRLARPTLLVATI